jgi:phosphinothricin acetyltransferase
MPQLSYTNATAADLPLVVAIYNQTIPSRTVTADLEPITVESRIPWFEKHTPDKRPLWMVKNEAAEIVGWVSFSNFYGRPAYAATAEISIYLDSTKQGKGYGRQILMDCLTKSKDLGIKNLIGFIFSHNLRSLKLFHACGFADWGLLPHIAVLDGVVCSVNIVGINLPS